MSTMISRLVDSMSDKELAEALRAASKRMGDYSRMNDPLAPTFAGALLGVAVWLESEKTPPLSLDERHALMFNRQIPGYESSISKISAIKSYRTRTGYGLKEAKDAIDAWCLENGY